MLEGLRAMRPDRLLCIVKGAICAAVVRPRPGFPDIGNILSLVCRRRMNPLAVGLLPSPEPGREVGPFSGLTARVASSPLFELALGSSRCIAGARWAPSQHAVLQRCSVTAERAAKSGRICIGFAPPRMRSKQRHLATALPTSSSGQWSWTDGPFWIDRFGARSICVREHAGWTRCSSRRRAEHFYRFEIVDLRVPDGMVTDSCVHRPALSAGWRGTRPCACNGRREVLNCDLRGTAAPRAAAPVLQGFSTDTAPVHRLPSVCRRGLRSARWGQGRSREKSVVVEQRRLVAER